MTKCKALTGSVLKGLKQTDGKKRRQINDDNARRTDCWTFPDVFRASRENVAQWTRRRRSRSSCWWCCTESRRPSRPSSRACCSPKRRRCRRREKAVRRRRRRRRWWRWPTWLVAKTASTTTARWTRCANGRASRPCCVRRGEWSYRAVRPRSLSHTGHPQQSSIVVSLFTPQ